VLAGNVPSAEGTAGGDVLNVEEEGVDLVVKVEAPNGGDEEGEDEEERPDGKGG
jgi:hypothetical protein